MSRIFKPFMSRQIEQCNTLKGVYQIVYQLVRWSGLNDQAILLEYNTLKGVCQMLPSDWPICLALNSSIDDGQAQFLPFLREIAIFRTCALAYLFVL